MKNKFILFTFFALLSVAAPQRIFANIHDEHDDDSATHDHANDEDVATHALHDEHNHDEDAATAASEPDITPLIVPEDIQKLLALSFATVTELPVVETMRIPGKFETAPGAKTVYAAPLRGRLKMRARLNQTVKKGDALFSLKSPEWVRETGAIATLKAELEGINTRMDNARVRQNRMTEAGRTDAALSAELLEMSADANRVSAELEALKQIRDMVLTMAEPGDDGLLVNALADGRVVSVAADNGAWAETGAEVLAVVGGGGVWFRADANASEIVALRNGQKAFVDPPQDAADADAVIHGSIETGFPESGNARTIPVYFIANDDAGDAAAWTSPGRAGVLHVVTAESRNHALTVPQAAIVADGLARYVFVRDRADDTLFHKRRVIVGAQNGARSEVAGVAEGDVVVLGGVYELNIAAPAADAPSKKAGHFHADGTFDEGGH